VIALRVDAAARALTAFGSTIACTIGRAGACPVGEKREGDGMTPTGTWPIRGVLLRRDRVAAPSKLSLPWRWLRPDDGWSDDPADPAYNRPVRHPHPFSAERLWREDGLYDVIVVLGHNDAPPVAGMGSAVFLHCWSKGSPTEGCVAIAPEELLDILPAIEADSLVRIV
jgi:L,D-peptidoglycan transpeptidase YkuD (ErfK/YbiS/YcfS/YnhG family)